MKNINQISAQIKKGGTLRGEANVLSGVKAGLPINFNVLHLKDGLKRMVNKLEPSASLRALRGEADD